MESRPSITAKECNSTVSQNPNVSVKQRKTFRVKKDKTAVKSVLLDEEEVPCESQGGDQDENMPLTNTGKKRAKKHATGNINQDEFTGVPRADTIGVAAAADSLSGLDFSISASQSTLLQPGGATSMQSESFVALVNGIRAMQDLLNSQYQLTQQVIEWQQKFEAGHLQHRRSQERLGNSILQRQKQLEDRIRLCMQGQEKMLAPSSLNSTPNDLENEDGSEIREEVVEIIEEDEIEDQGLKVEDVSVEQPERDQTVIIGTCDAPLLQGIQKIKPERDSKTAGAKSMGAKSMHVKYKWTRAKSDKHAGHAEERCVERIVEHPYFEYMSACVILSHSLFIGIYVEYTASFDADGHVGFTIGNLFLTMIFLCEVFLKFAAEKKVFVTGHERIWNIFDLCLVCIVLLEMSLGIVLAGKDKKKMKTVLKIAEMARTVRILRIFRCLKFSETLQVIIVKIFMSIRTLVWVLLLVGMMQGVIAVCFTQGTVEFLGGIQHDPDIEMSPTQKAVHEHFGSVPKSMYTCFASISGGIMWSEIYEELGHVSILYALIFGFYIVASTFAVLNVITGIFINDMLRAEKQLEEESRHIKLARYHEELEVLFANMDSSGHGKISLSEFLTLTEIGNQTLNDILDDLNMRVEEMPTLFQLLDENSTGELDVDEFLSGCIHLMASTTGMDVKVMLHEQRRIRHNLNKWMNNSDIKMQSTDSSGQSVDHSPIIGMNLKAPKTLAGKMIADSETKRAQSRIMKQHTCTDLSALEKA